MAVVLRASSRLSGICSRRFGLIEQTVEVRNVQGGTHRVLNEILSIHKTIRAACGFLFLRTAAPGPARIT